MALGKWLGGGNKVRISQNKKTSLRALTLVEILVASTILAIVIAGVIGSFVSSQRIIIRSNRRLLAANYVRQAFEELRWSVDARDWADGVDGDRLDPTGGVPKPCNINMGAFALAPFNATCEYEVASILNDARQVTVTIRWTEP
ncbi:MAG: type II secretion system protein [Candidatus Omnitrophota bacterium]